MNIDTQMVRMNHYLDTKLVGSALTVDHDIKRQFESWYDTTNLRLFDQWIKGTLVGEEPPKVTDACANSYAKYMCSNLMPNCTYMPWARWPYNNIYEKIYVCKEVCEDVITYCDTSWLPHDMRCVDFISKTIDEEVDPKWEMTHYARRDAGGHACSNVELTERFVGSATSVQPWHAPSLCLLLMAAMWQVGRP